MAYGVCAARVRTYSTFVLDFYTPIISTLDLRLKGQVTASHARENTAFHTLHVFATVVDTRQALKGYMSATIPHTRLRLHGVGTCRLVPDGTKHGIMPCTHRSGSTLPLLLVSLLLYAPLAGGTVFAPLVRAVRDNVFSPVAVTGAQSNKLVDLPASVARSLLERLPIGLDDQNATPRRLRSLSSELEVPSDTTWAEYSDFLSQKVSRRTLIYKLTFQFSLA